MSGGRELTVRSRPETGAWGSLSGQRIIAPQVRNGPAPLAKAQFLLSGPVFFASATIFSSGRISLTTGRLGSTGNGMIVFLKPDLDGPALLDMPVCPRRAQGRLSQKWTSVV